MAPRNRRKFTTSAGGVHRPPAGYTTTDNPPAGFESRVRGNPYQFKGPVEGFEAKAVEEGLYLSVDMPGVSDGGAEVWMEGKELFFQGEAHKEAEFEANRVYGGCIDLSSDPEEISEMKFDLKNGVLRIVLVGCSIQPDLSDLAGSSSSTHSSSNGTPYEWCRAGNYLIGFRSFSAVDPIDGSRGIYPFQLSGPLESCETKVLDCDHMFMRVDMPDVPSKAKTVKFRDGVVLFGGEGESGSGHNEECRGYFGRQRLQCGCCKYVGVQSEIKYGVLRMLIEKKKIKSHK